LINQNEAFTGKYADISTFVVGRQYFYATEGTYVGARRIEKWWVFNSTRMMLKKCSDLII
jgi:hypothetical protein